RARADEGRAAHVPDLVGALPGREPVRNLDDLPLAVAEYEEIRLRVEQDRAAHLLLPVVEVRDAPEAGLDSADHDRHVGIGFARTLRVDEDGPVRTLSADSARRVRVVAA